MDQNRILFHVQITFVGHKYLVQIGSVVDIVSHEKKTVNIYQILNVV